MLKKSSAFMMLLIVTASIIGISTVYKPVDIETQRQQPQQMVPNSGKILGQQQQQAPGTQGLVTQKEFQTTSQILADTLLLDRLFPQIVKRLDGKTLATKVLPYLDISANVIRREGAADVLNVQDVARDLGLTGAEPLSSTAKCNSGEIAVSGGYTFSSDPEDSYVSAEALGENGWGAYALMKDNGEIKASVTCLTINVGLKNVQQPQQQPQQPSPPPGGPPLRPPPNLR
jgi:hypothetical protein